MNQHTMDHAQHHVAAQQRPPLRLSSNPKKAMQDMMDTIDQLRAVYKEETQALDKSDVKAFMALQDMKLTAARNYQDGVAQMIARKDEMKDVDPDLRGKLRDMQADFSKLAVKNMKALERMQKAMDRFGGTLSEAAREAVKKERATSYTASGKMSTDEIKRITTGSISETV